MDISFILPTYNEVDSAHHVIDRILGLFPNDGCAIEIIVVDDCSPDGTAAFIGAKYATDERVKVLIRKGRERGLGNSILDGIRFSIGDIIVGLDADGNHPPELIPTLLRQFQNGIDVVVASRFINKNRHCIHGIQDCGSFLFNSIIRCALKYPITDNTSGFYAIKRNVLEHLPLEDIFVNAYGEYHLRLMYAAYKKEYTIVEVPVIYEKRIGGKSKSLLMRMMFSYIYEAYIWKKEFNHKYED